MICDRYETIIVPFPFAEIPAVKRRPVVLLSGPGFNARNKASAVALITTAKASAWPSDIPIIDLTAAGLPKNCVVRWRLATIPNDLILNRIGVLGVEDSLACERELARMFA